MSAVPVEIYIVAIVFYAGAMLFITVKLLLFFTKNARTGKVRNAQPEYSVVVAFKNESANLPALLWGLLRQTHKPSKIILVNDNSTDNFREVLYPYLRAFPFIEVINSSGNGKKQALLQGIDRVETEWIAITDADSIPHPEWACGMLNHAVTYKLDLVGGMVVGGGKNFTEVMGTIDLMAQLSLSCVMSREPVTISAASLFVRKSVWEAVKDKWISVPSSSGDDVFMLYFARELGFKTGFYCGRESAVTTQMPETIHDLIKQRTRWASKIAYYRNDRALLILALVGLFSIVHLLAIINFKWWFFVVKMVVDLAYLSGLTLPFTYFHWFRYFPIISLTYPIFVLIIGFNALLSREQWNRE